MENIKDMSIYTQRMQTTIIDKLFWTKDIFTPISQLVDIGCADGTLLNIFGTLSPATELIGVDNCEEMRLQIPKNVQAFASLADVGKLKENSVLNLSSVLHEIYSYCDTAAINDFWSDVLASGAEYITIRDMYNADSQYNNLYFSSIRNAILESKFNRQLKEFEKVWGKIDNNHNLVHFLLKYNYKENWERELHENYLSWDLSDIETALKDKYTLIYEESDTLPYITHKVKEDFDMYFDGQTHIKLIFKRGAHNE